MDDFKSIICNRCGSRSGISVNDPIEEAYCECGGKYEYDTDEYYASLYEPVQIMEKKEVFTGYNKRKEDYKKLKNVLINDLNSYIKGSVSKFTIESRIKSFENFYEKVLRKGCADPFNQIEDICGIRIICYYPSDLETISKIIKSSFEILKSVDKSDLLQYDEFGYRSIHFIVKIKSINCNLRKYKGLNGLKAEIQLRTLLMDAHASIEHDLLYKKQEYIPYKFQRRSSQLSAILETVDEQFQHLKDDLKEYKKNVNDSIKKVDFDVNQELTMETLQDFLDYYFPDKQKIPAKTAELFESLEIYNNNVDTDKISLKTILTSYEQVKVDLDDLERKHFAYKENEYKWHQSECLQQILWLTQPKYINYFTA